MPELNEWTMKINYGPEGEANYANVYSEAGEFVGNLRVHHAKAIVAALAAQQLRASVVSPDSVTDLFLAAWAEADKAMRKFPQPNYVISKVAEEAGEVVKAAIHCAEGRDTPEHVVAEIKQAMAMLIRLFVEGDQVHGLPPLTAALSVVSHETGDGETVAALPERCPECNLHWGHNPPAIISGTDQVRCIECKSVFPAPLEGVTVKPLEWWVADGSGDIIADSIVGRYRLGRVSANTSFRLETPDGLIEKPSPEYYWPEAEGKAAAQADYEARILSAIVGSAK